MRNESTSNIEEIIVPNENFKSVTLNPNFGVIIGSHNFKNLFVRMVAYDPNERPTIEQILFDVWMEEINN